MNIRYTLNNIKLTLYWLNANYLYTFCVYRQPMSGILNDFFYIFIHRDIKYEISIEYHYEEFLCTG